jgi:hypothetical protein
MADKKKETKKQKEKKDMDDLKQEMTLDDHSISLDELIARHHTDLEKVVGNNFKKNSQNKILTGSDQGTGSSTS